jgi:hypothetical protein
MAYTDTQGTENVRAEVIDLSLKNLVNKKYVFRQALSVVSTGAWKNTFWREDPTTLQGTKTTGITRNSFKEIGRGSAFPQATATWEEVSTRILKFGAEDNLTWEDVLSDNIDIETRTMAKIADAIAYAEDAYIWDTLTENRSVTNIQSVAIAATKHWTGASAAIINDLAYAKEKLKDYSYPTDNLICFISQRDERAIQKWITDKGSQFANGMADGVALNGSIGKLAGINLVVSNNVTASYALVVVPKICGTLKELESFKTLTKDDDGKSRTIRAWEQVTCQLTDPKACVLISNTQGPGTE